MIQRKIVLNIFDLNLPEDIVNYLCSQFFDEGIFEKIDAEFFEGIDLDNEVYESYKILLGVIKKLGIDLDAEGYILLTMECGRDIDQSEYDDEDLGI